MKLAASLLCDLFLSGRSTLRIVLCPAGACCCLQACAGADG